MIYTGHLKWINLGMRAGNRWSPVSEKETLSCSTMKWWQTYTSLLVRRVSKGEMSGLKVMNSSKKMSVIDNMCSSCLVNWSLLTCFQLWLYKLYINSYIVRKLTTGLMPSEKTLDFWCRFSTQQKLSNLHEINFLSVKDLNLLW